MASEFSIIVVFNYILITGVVYGFIFNSVFFFSTKRKGIPLYYLNLLVLFISLNNLQAWLIDMDITSSNVYIKYLRIPWYFLCMPIFYVFLVYYLKIQKKIKSFLYLTISLFICGIITRVLLIYYSQTISLSIVEVDKLFITFNTYEEIGSFIYTVIIFTYPLSLFNKNKKLLEYVMNYDDLAWIKHFLIIAGLILFVWIIAIVQNYNYDSFSAPEIYHPLRLCTSILIYWLGFKGLFRFRIMEDRIVLRENIKQELLLNKENLDLKLFKNLVNSKNTIKSEKQHELFKKINTYIINQKKYLDPYIGLDSLAEELNISSGHLSFLINTYSNIHFSDYINELRVKQVKKIIADKEYTNYTIVALGLESGFNSKSTFYAAFKKFTNLTPTAYKKQVVN